MYIIYVIVILYVFKNILVKNDFWFSHNLFSKRVLKKLMFDAAS